MRVGVAFSSPVRRIEPSVLPALLQAGEDPSPPPGSPSSTAALYSGCYSIGLLAASEAPWLIKSSEPPWVPCIRSPPACGAARWHLGLTNLCLHQQISTYPCPGLREGSGWQPGEGDSPAAMVCVARRSAALCPHEQFPMSSSLRVWCPCFSREQPLQPCAEGQLDAVQWFPLASSQYDHLATAGARCVVVSR